MTTLFELFVCLLEQFAELVAEGLMDVLNAVVVACAAVIGVVVALLPDMPSWPTGTSGVWGWLNWALPVASYVGVFGSVATLIALYLGLRIALKWMRTL
jgi:hypothetical protein